MLSSPKNVRLLKRRKTTEETNHYLLRKTFYSFPAPTAKSIVNHENDNHLIF